MAVSAPCSPEPRRAPALLLLALLLPLTGCGGANPEPASVDVERGREAVVALARLEPEGHVRRLGLADGDRLETLNVGEGDRVAEGALLATGRQYAIAAAEAASVRARLSEAEAQHAAETSAGEAAIRQSELQLETSRAELVLARQDEEREARLFSQGLSTEQAWERAERHREEAELEARRAEVRLELSRAEAERAREAIPLTSLRAELALVEARMEAAAIRAPSDGQVLKIHVWPGELTSGRPVIQFGRTQQMYAIAEVYETDIHLVRVGQRATLSSSALPVPIEGVVEQAGLLIFRNDIFGDDPSAPVDGRVFQVLIRLTESDTAARFTNHEVEARIFLGEPERG